MDTRIKRLLLSRIDNPSVLQTLDIYSSLQRQQQFSLPSSGTNSSIPSLPTSVHSSLPSSSSYSSSSLSLALEDSSTNGIFLIQQFLNELRPTIQAVEYLVDTTTQYTEAITKAEESIDISTKAAEEFISSASNLQDISINLRKEIQIAHAIAEEFTISSSVITVLQTGPVLDNLDAFFTAIDTLLQLKRKLDARIVATELNNDQQQQQQQQQPNTVTETGTPFSSSSESTASIVSSTSSVSLLGILTEQREIASGIEATAFDTLFDWALKVCENTDDSSILSSSFPATSTMDSVQLSNNDSLMINSLRKAIVLFYQYRPAYLSSCQSAFIHGRRSIFLRKFLSNITTLSTSSSTNFTFQDIEISLSELLAFVHGHIAEESIFISSIFSTDETNGRKITIDNSSSIIELNETNNPPILTSKQILSNISNSIATPISIRISAMFDDLPTLFLVFRLLDIVLFYQQKLSSLIESSSSLLTILHAIPDRAKVRLDQLVTILVERIKSFPPSLPTKLVPPPLTSDVCAELDAVLNASKGILSEALPQYLTPEICLKSIIPPLLEYCRNSAEGMDLVSVSIWMLNNTSTIQTILLPHPYTAEMVQMLAGEIATWEESLVSAVSDEILRESGILQKLTSLRTVPEGTNIYELITSTPRASLSSELANITSEQLMVTLSTFVRKVASPTLLSTVELLSHPKVRSRTRRDVSSLLCSAYSRLRDDIMNPSRGYVQDTDFLNLMNALPADLSVVISS